METTKKISGTALSAVLAAGEPVTGDKVSHALRKLGEAYAETFRGAVEQGFSNPILAKVLSDDYGEPINRQQVQYYRQKLREGKA